MEGSSDSTPEYMVAVKREYLVPIKNEGKRTYLADSDGKTSQSSDQIEQKIDLEIRNEGDESTTSNSAVIAQSVVTVDGETPEGYKSNGYKIDDRDRQQNSGWKNKDYTGGMKFTALLALCTAHHNCNDVDLPYPCVETN